MRRLLPTIAGLMLIALLCSGCDLMATPTPTPTPTAGPPPPPTMTPRPTYSPLPTWTSQPTYTPYPTYTPLPTFTPVPAATPTPTRTPAPTATAVPTRAPAPPAPPPAPPPVPKVAPLVVSIRNIHYEQWGRPPADDLCASPWVTDRSQPTRRIAFEVTVLNNGGAIYAWPWPITIQKNNNVWVDWCWSKYEETGEVKPHLGPGAAGTVTIFAFTEPHEWVKQIAVDSDDKGTFRWEWDLAPDGVVLAQRQRP